MNYYYEEGVTEEPIKIKNAFPIIIDKLRHEIVCIPKSPDPYLGLIAGKRGSGKTTAEITTLCGIHNYHRESCFVGNDTTGESDYWVEKQTNYKFKNKIKSIGVKPHPLPIVHVYPNHKNIKIGNVPYYIKYGIPYKEFIKNLEKFRDIGASLDYYKPLVPELLALEEEGPTIEKIFSIINKSDMNKNSKSMFRNVIRNFLETQKLLDLEEDTVGAVEMREGELNHGEYNVINALAYAGFIPVLKTHSIKGEKYLHKYVDNVLRILWENQIKGYSKKYEKKMNIFLDETRSLVIRDKETDCKEIINQIAVEGRPEKIGLWCTTQHPKLLTDEIKTNIDYCIALRNDSKQMKFVGESVDFSKKDIKEIQHLPTFRCIATSTNKEWLIINTKTGKSYRSKGIVRGEILPPQCSTKPPSMEGLYEVN